MYSWDFATITGLLLQITDLADFKLLHSKAYKVVYFYMGIDIYFKFYCILNCSILNQFYLFNYINKNIGNLAVPEENYFNFGNKV